MTRLELATLAPFHLVGIGGVGMSALARVLAAEGIAVRGSDAKESATLENLRAAGVDVVIGHDRANLAGARTLVVSSAIREQNPELVEARHRGVPIIHRAQLLALVARGRRTVAVTGTHGKTTTSAMLATILVRAGMDPTFLVGSEVTEQGTNAHAGRGDIVVAEADESDGSLLWLAPELLILTNAEAEHLDHYRDLDEILATFDAAVAQIPAGGRLIACIDDPGARRVLEGAPANIAVRAYGTGAEASDRIDPSGQIFRDGIQVARIELAVPGAHNRLNALAAFCAALELGVPPEVAAAGLAAFRGTRRRFDDRGTAGGIRVVDDYAHHPTEVTATLEAARGATTGRILVVFQPHLFSRTARLGAALGAALARGADAVAILPIEASREDPMPEVTSRILLDGALDAVPRRSIAMLRDRNDVPRWVTARARPGDLVFTMGAGDVTTLGPDILEACAGRGGGV